MESAARGVPGRFFEVALRIRDGDRVDEQNGWPVLNTYEMEFSGDVV